MSVNSLIDWLKLSVRLFLWGGSCLIPRRRSKLVFGAWTGKSYSDNSKYLFEYFFNREPYRIIWVGEGSLRQEFNNLPSNSSFACAGSLRAYWHLLTSKYWIFTHSASDLCKLPIFGGAIFFNVDHGTWGLKKLGSQKPAVKLETKNKEGIRSLISQVMAPRRAYHCATNHLIGERLRKAYPMRTEYIELPFGSATFDFLLKNKDNFVLKQAYKRAIGAKFSLPLDKKWIVYAPTFRWLTDSNFSFLELKGVARERLEHFLKRENAIIIEKHHPRYLFSECNKRQNSGYVFPICGSEALLLDQNNLWLIADLCISDYSGSAYHSYFAGNPVIHFAYDRRSYETEDTGLEYPLEDVRVGSIAESVEELLGQLEAGVERTNCVGCKIPVLFEYEVGEACERFEQFIREHAD